jgi:hypothetical protein
LERNGSFEFAEGLALCFGAKANMQFVQLANIVLKKCALGKIKNTEALEVDSTFWGFIFPFMFWLLSISFILFTVEFLSFQVSYIRHLNIHYLFVF